MEKGAIHVRKGEKMKKKQKYDKKEGGYEKKIRGILGRRQV